MGKNEKKESDKLQKNGKNGNFFSFFLHTPTFHYSQRNNMPQPKKKTPKKKKQVTLDNELSIPFQETAQPIEKELEVTTPREVVQTVPDPSERSSLVNVNSNTEDTGILGAETVPAAMHTHLPMSIAHPQMEEEFSKT